MKSKMVKATFRGQNGSCGYITGNEYHIVITHSLGNFIKIKLKKEEGGYNEYQSLIAFLNNWDNIKTI